MLVLFSCTFSCSNYIPSFSNGFDQRKSENIPLKYQVVACRCNFNNKRMKKSYFMLKWSIYGNSALAHGAIHCGIHKRKVHRPALLTGLYHFDFGIKMVLGMSNVQVHTVSLVCSILVLLVFRTLKLTSTANKSAYFKRAILSIEEKHDGNDEKF